MQRCAKNRGRVACPTGWRWVVQFAALHCCQIAKTCDVFCDNHEVEPGSTSVAREVCHPPQLDRSGSRWKWMGNSNISTREKPSVMSLYYSFNANKHHPALIKLQLKQHPHTHTRSHCSSCIASWLFPPCRRDVQYHKPDSHIPLRKLHPSLQPSLRSNKRPTFPNFLKQMLTFGCFGVWWRQTRRLNQEGEKKHCCTELSSNSPWQPVAVSVQTQLRVKKRKKHNVLLVKSVPFTPHWRRELSDWFFFPTSCF